MPRRYGVQDDHVIIVALTGVASISPRMIMSSVDTAPLLNTIESVWTYQSSSGNTCDHHADDRGKI